MSETETSWIAAAAGADHVHLRAIGVSGAVLSEDHPPRSDWHAAARRLAAGDTLPVVACGLPEAGLRKVPGTPIQDALAVKETHGLTLAAIPGLAQETPSHVTTGAETAIAGFLSLNPKFDGVLCLPGPQTTWAHVSAEEVVSFQTCLSQPLGQAIETWLELDAAAWDDATFESALTDTLARPERLAERLAAIRGAGMLLGLDPAAARGRLWGALIGAELAAMRPYWLGQQVAVVGGGTLAGAYVSAITAQGLPPIRADGAAMLLKGLAEGHRRLAMGA